jgi:probable HAF family extracellular repeat protein
LAQVVGFSANDTGCTGFIWQDGVITPLIDLSSSLCLNSANGINRRGDVAGTIAAGFALHAATWSEGTITDLGVLTPSGQTFSPHHGINDRGIVSGSGHLDEFGCVFTGAAWTAGDVVILPTLSSSCSVNFAYGINNRGQIAGTASTDTGEFHAVLWTIDTRPPSVDVRTLTPRLPPSGKKRIPVAFFGRVSDEGSGIASATYRVVDEYGTVEPAGTLELDDDGRFLVVVQIEPSRRGNDRDGRLYRLVVTATDRAGNEGSDTASVTIVHDQRRDD